MQIDPVSLEVIRNRLDVIAEEMQATLLRSAHSSIIKEGLDASAAIFDAKPQLVAQANALPIHLGSLGPVVERICEVFPPHQMSEGDVYIMNDPYDGAQHIPDVVIVVPVITDGHLLALTCSMAHQQDMGGKAPGSTPTDATEIYQEGLIIPPLKMYDRGRPNDTLLAILRKNVRISDTVLGDMEAQIAAANTGQHHLVELCKQYGSNTVALAMQELQDRAETMTREGLSTIPDGEYEFEDYLDNDGIDVNKRITIRAKVQVTGSDIIVDFTGSDPQTRGPFNAVPSVALSAVRYVVRAITDPEIPNNAGCYRPVTVITPSGSIVNPSHPAPVNSRAVTLRRMLEVVLGALVPAIPDRVTAANNGHPFMGSVGGFDPKTGRHYVTSIVATGGMGARPTKDGAETIQTDASNAMSIPVESMETYYPLRAHKWALRDDSGGAGRWRGGIGLEHVVEVVRGEVRVSHRGERHYTSPWGLFGGRAGARSKTDIVRRNGEVTAVPSKQDFTLQAGDKVHIYTTGGGGYGDPLDREPERVLADVLDRKVSMESAVQSYGVVLVDGATPSLDYEATDALREQMRETRGPITWIYDRGPVSDEARAES